MAAPEVAWASSPPQIREARDRLEGAVLALRWVQENHVRLEDEHREVFLQVLACRLEGADTPHRLSVELGSLQVRLGQSLVVLDTRYGDVRAATEVLNRLVLAHCGGQVSS